MGSSAFDSLTKLRKERQGHEAPEPEAPQEPQPEVIEAATPAKQGRPAGKRSSGEHMQVTAYIRKDTHRATKLALLQNEDERDFSELVDDLLQDWLKQQRK